MCGFAGIWNLNKEPLNIEKLRAMNNSIKHRGPDDEGFFLTNTASSSAGSFCSGDDTITAIKSIQPALGLSNGENLGIGFRRLSIIDISHNGHQPMTDETGRYVIVFNGEIYNYGELREELLSQKVTFKTNSDTEVLLKSYIYWGEACVNKFNGMWAFVIYDTYKKNIFCSRDRFGVKPFYYYKDKDQFIFASEIKALLHFVPFEVNEGAVFNYLAHGVTTTNEHTFFKNIIQLQPGYNIVLNETEFKNWQYYLPKEKIEVKNFEEAKIGFKEIFTDAVKIRQRSDVPFGYALSGGIDSSSIVCMASTLKGSDENVSFSLVFKNTDVDESQYIDYVINKTKFKSKSLTLSGEDFYTDFKKFVYHQEEPFGSPSYFGEFKLKELMAQSSIKMSLEGQGADEIISGYISLTPYYYFDLIRELKFKTLLAEKEKFKKYYFASTLVLIRRYLKYKFRKKQGISFNRYPYIYWDRFSDTKQSLVSRKLSYKSKSVLNNELFKMLTLTSIPEQIIRADKSAMAFSIESRFPFLDYRLTEYALNTPYNYKMSAGTTKILLRESLKDYLPNEVYERKDKIGFAVPVQNWVTDKLWSTLSNYLTTTDFPYLDVEAFRKTYPTKEAVDWKFWKIISLVAWYEEYKTVSQQFLQSNS